MVLILKEEKVLDKRQIRQKIPMRTYSCEDNGEYQYSSKTSYNNNELTHIRQRQPDQRRNPCELTNIQTSELSCTHKQDQSGSHSKEENTNSFLIMNVDILKSNSAIDSQTPSSKSRPNISDADACYKLQSEFRSCGWNIAGANLLAVSCWIAKSHFLYARPRLTGLDFVIASIITGACGVLASLLSWFLLGTNTSEQIVQVASVDKGGAELPTPSENSTTYYVLPIIGVLAVVAGGAYLLCKVSQWQPIETIIQRQMGRAVQREFVCALVQVCQESNIDPENIDDLMAISESTGFKELHMAMLDFFKSRLKMQE